MPTTINMTINNTSPITITQSIWASLRTKDKLNIPRSKNKKQIRDQHPIIVRNFNISTLRKRRGT